MQKIIERIIARFEPAPMKIVTPKRVKTMVPYLIDNRVHYRWELKEIVNV